MTRLIALLYLLLISVFSAYAQDVDIPNESMLNLLEKDFLGFRCKVIDGKCYQGVDDLHYFSYDRNFVKRRHKFYSSLVQSDSLWAQLVHVLINDSTCINYDTNEYQSIDFIELSSNLEGSEDVGKDYISGDCGFIDCSRIVSQKRKAVAFLIAVNQKGESSAHLLFLEKTKCKWSIVGSEIIGIS